MEISAHRHAALNRTQNRQRSKRLDIPSSAFDQGNPSTLGLSSLLSRRALRAALVSLLVTTGIGSVIGTEQAVAQPLQHEGAIAYGDLDDTEGLLSAPLLLGTGTAPAPVLMADNFGSFGEPFYDPSFDPYYTPSFGSFDSFDTYQNAAAGSRTLSPGDSGSDVAELQRILSERGFYRGSIDGIYGPETERAVRSFQSFRGLQVDGVAGPATWNALLGGGSFDPFFPSTGFGTGLNAGPYTVVVPAGRDNLEALRTARLVVPSAQFARSRRGSFIYAGGFPEREPAERLSLLLRARGLDSQVAYFRDNVEFFF